MRYSLYICRIILRQNSVQLDICYRYILFNTHTLIVRHLLYNTFNIVTNDIQQLDIGKLHICPSPNFSIMSSFLFGIFFHQSEVATPYSWQIKYGKISKTMIADSMEDEIYN